jgi:hypothetical protein
MSKYGSVDVTIGMPTFETGEWLGIKADVQEDEDGADTHISVRIYENEIHLISEPSGDTIDKVSLAAIVPSAGNLFTSAFLPMFVFSPSFTPQDDPSIESTEEMRILFENESVTIYRNGDYLHSFFVPVINYPDDEATVSLVCSVGWTTAPTVATLVAELDDWREAIYIETESVAISGISSVIQQRPVNILSMPDGGLDFFYDKSDDPYAIASDIIRTHDLIEMDAASASDALVEGMDVYAVSYPTYADEIGYTFRMIRLNSLDSGYRKAASTILRRAMEDGEAHKIEMRPDLRVQPNDVLSISTTVSGTERSLIYAVHVSSTGLSIENGIATLALEGRTKL